jgi:hypothetical protein
MSSSGEIVAGGGSEGERRYALGQEEAIGEDEWVDGLAIVVERWAWCLESPPLVGWRNGHDPNPVLQSPVRQW